jgi:hypothetical protein
MRVFPCRFHPHFPPADKAYNWAFLAPLKAAFDVASQRGPHRSPTGFGDKAVR